MAARATTQPRPVKTQPESESKAETRPDAIEEQIRARAYELYLQRGSGAGTEVDDWLQAEAEINPRR